MSRSITVASTTTPPLGSFTVTCRSPVATPPWPKVNAESSRQHRAMRMAFTVGIVTVRFIEISLELAEREWTVERLPRRIAELDTKLIGLGVSRWFLYQKVSGK